MILHKSPLAWQSHLPRGESATCLRAFRRKSGVISTSSFFLSDGAQRPEHIVSSMGLREAEPRSHAPAGEGGRDPGLRLTGEEVSGSAAESQEVHSPAGLACIHQCQPSTQTPGPRALFSIGSEVWRPIDTYDTTMSSPRTSEGNECNNREMVFDPEFRSVSRLGPRTPFPPGKDNGGLKNLGCHFTFPAKVLWQRLFFMNV